MVEVVLCVVSPPELRQSGPMGFSRPELIGVRVVKL